MAQRELGELRAMIRMRPARGIGFVAISLVPSLVVARVAAANHHVLNWEVLGVIGTAIGTLLLAISTKTLAERTTAAVELQVDDQRLHRSPLVIHDWSEIRDATPDEARDANREPGRALAISVRLVNAGEGPATDVAGEVSYDEPRGELRPLPVSLHASVVLPGRERKFIFIVGPGDLSVDRHEQFAAAQRVRVTGTFSDPRRLLTYSIRPNEPTNSKTLAKTIGDDTSGDQAGQDDAMTAPLMVPERPGGASSSVLDAAGQKRMVNLRANFNVQNKGPTAVALEVGGGLELDGVEYADTAMPHPALGVGATMTVQVTIPDSALANLPEATALNAFTCWVRFTDQRERHWRTTLDPSGQLRTEREYR